MGNPIPYFPVEHDRQHRRGAQGPHQGNDQRRRSSRADTVPKSDWKFCGGGTFAAPVPATSAAGAASASRNRASTRPSSTRSNTTVKDPYVLGVGTAAFRDLGSFFRYATAANRHGQSARRRDQLGDHPRLVAVGQLHAPLHPSRHEPGRGRAHRARRRLAAHRRAARGEQLALGPARRRARALPDGQRRPAMVDALPGHVAICPRAGYSTAASAPIPARRSSRPSAALKSSRSR